MKINNDPNIASLASNAAAKTQETSRSAPGARSGPSQNAATTSNDDVHLSELVKSLRSLAADSPERQAKIEALTRSYASGTYKVDSEATASKIIDDANKSSY